MAYVHKYEVGGHMMYLVSNSRSKPETFTVTPTEGWRGVVSETSGNVSRALEFLSKAPWKDVEEPEEGEEGTEKTARQDIKAPAEVVVHSSSAAKPVDVKKAVSLRVKGKKGAYEYALGKDEIEDLDASGLFAEVEEGKEAKFPAEVTIHGSGTAFPVGQRYGVSLLVKGKKGSYDIALTKAMVNQMEDDIDAEMGQEKKSTAITEELDRIATEIQAEEPIAAMYLDKISDTLEGREAGLFDFGPLGDIKKILKEIGGKEGTMKAKKVGNKFFVSVEPSSIREVQDLLQEKLEAKFPAPKYRIEIAPKLNHVVVEEMR